MPKKHKSEATRNLAGFGRNCRRLLDDIPGLRSTGALFQRLTGVLYCVKDREGRYISANDAFLRRVRIADRHPLPKKPIPPIQKTLRLCARHPDPP